jgi:hypothetical protein
MIEDYQTLFIQRMVGHTFEMVPMDVDATKVEMLFHDAKVLALRHGALGNLHNLQHCVRV